MLRKIKLYLTFYRAFCTGSLFLSLVCANILFIYGIGPFVTLFWFKIISLGLIYFYIKNYKASTFYFYKNMGASRKGLWICSISSDMMLYLALTITAVILHGKYT